MSETHFEAWQPSRTPSQLANDTAGNAHFRVFVEQHRLSLLDVALAAGVRLMTVWNIQQGRPVRAASAQAVRAALLRLTGRPYGGPIMEQDAHE